MDKPPYELEPLRAAVAQCDVNIAAMQAGIDKEVKHKTELQELIDLHEKWIAHGNSVQQGG